MKLDDLKARLEAFLDRPEIVSLVAVKDGDMVNITTRTIDPFAKIADLEALVGELGEALRPYLAVLAEKPQKANWTDRYCDARDQLESVARATLAKLEKARGKDQEHG